MANAKDIRNCDSNGEFFLHAKECTKKLGWLKEK